MKKETLIVIFGICLLMLGACRQHEGTKSQTAILRVDLGIDLPLQVTLIRQSDYTVVLDSVFQEQGFSFVIDSISPSVYLLELAWEAQNLSREEMRMMLKGELDEISTNVLQKILYIDPRQDSLYTLRLDVQSPVEDLELRVRKNDPQYSLILETAAKDAQLLESFEAIDRELRIDYHRKMDSLTRIRYDQGMDGSSDSAIEQQQTELWAQGKYQERKIQATKDLMLKNMDSPIIPYVLYSYGYALREIEAFKPVISKMDKSYVHTEYGRLLKNLL